jgi:hypothetical protein
MGFAVGEWIAPYTQVLEVLEAGSARDGAFETYRVLHGDAVPREVVLRRYRVVLPIDSALLRQSARDLRLYELRVVGDLGDAVLELYGDDKTIARFHTRYSRRWPR